MDLKALLTKLRVDLVAKDYAASFSDVVQILAIVAPFIMSIWPAQAATASSVTTFTAHGPLTTDAAVAHIDEQLAAVSPNWLTLIPMLLQLLTTLLPFLHPALTPRP